MVVLGVHDLGQKSAQTILVDEVFSPMHDAGFPPRADLSLLRLSVAARFGKKQQKVQTYYQQDFVWVDFTLDVQNQQGCWFLASLQESPEK